MLDRSIQADGHKPLSEFFRDPLVSAAFRRAEGEGGAALCVVDPILPLLGGESVRQAIEAHIERMIALLDELDGDPDLEPALGWTFHGPQWLSEASHNDEDREWDDERELDYAEMGIADLDGAMEQCPGFYYGSIQ